SALTVRTIAVAVSRMEITTPGMTAPDASLMVPESAAPETCAQAWPGERTAMTKMTKTEKLAVNLFKEILCNIDVPSRRLDDGLLVRCVPMLRRFICEVEGILTGGASRFNVVCKSWRHY